MGSPVSLCNGLYARLLLMGKSNRDLSSRETTEEEEEKWCVSGDGDEEEERWCRENRFCFYLVKKLAYDGLEIKAKIDEADDEIYNRNSEKNHIANRLKAKRAERLSLPASFESLVSSLAHSEDIEKAKQRREKLFLTSIKLV